MQCSETALEKLEPLLLVRNERQDPHECSDSSMRHLFICKRNSSDVAMWIVGLRDRLSDRNLWFCLGGQAQTITQFLYNHHQWITRVSYRIKRSKYMI